MTRLAFLLVTLAMAPALAWADPPGRVGRLSLVEGEASVFADPELGWESARINTHLTSENSVWTEPRSRAEVQIGATALRLEEATQLDIVRLDDDALHAHLARGSLAVRIQNAEKTDAYTVSTPEARFRLRGNGRYRIDTDLDRRESRLTVFSGNARLEAAGGTIKVDTGRSVRVSGGERPGYEIEPASTFPIDEWALARDQRYAERETARYVPPQMTGWEELDDYGTWRNEPEYGAVWYPTRVDAGWAPYRYGRWTWVRPWGWAWVDDAPWGYAPFHYGRWVSIGNRWGWYPGRYVARPIWAPALVGWVGTPGWSVSISSRPTPVVGWYPLSPYERYQPWYSTNVTYVNNVNNVVIVNRRPGDRGDHRYDNRDRGATVVTRENLFSRRPVQGIRAPVTGDVIAAQPVVSGTAVLPSQNEWRGRVKPVQTATPPAGGASVTRRPGTAPSAPGAQPGRPVASAPSAPSYPATPAPARVVKPAPAEPVVRAKPVESAPQQARPNAPTRPAPAEPVPRAKPTEPGAQQPRPNAVARPAPAESATRSKPPQAQGGEARAPRAVEPSAVPAEPRGKPAPAPAKPVQEKPAQAKPAAEKPVHEKPAQAKPAQEKPVQEKPARGGEPQATPVEKPSRTAVP